MNYRLKTGFYCLLAVILCGSLVFNLYFGRSAILGLIIGALYLLFFGYVFGCLLFARNNPPFRLFYGLFSLISLFSLLGAVVYYLFNLNLAIIATLLLLVPFSFLPFLTKREINFEFAKKEKPKDRPLVPLLSLIFLVLAGFCFYLLWQARTTEALRAPWTVLGPLFLIAYCLNTAVLFTIILTSKKTHLSLGLIFIQSFLSLSVALFIYQLGYGFDSFIHQATEKTIADFGLINPKPLYYLGQYSLAVILAKLFWAPVIVIDKLLAPILASLFLPTTIYLAFSRGFNWDKKYSLALALLFLALPFSQFIVTTPQGLANIYFLIVIFLSLLYLTQPAKLSAIVYLFFLGLTALLIHPLTGIPLLIFLALLAFYTHFNQKETIAKIVRQSLFWEIFLLAAIALPAVFIINSGLNADGLATTIDWSVLGQPAQIIKTLNLEWPAFQKLFHPLQDFAYSYQFYLPYAIFGLALIGLLSARKKHQFKSLGVYLTTFLVLLINFLLLKLFITFPSLIYYEQGDYPQRVWQLNFYFLIPFLFYLVYQLIAVAWAKKIYALKIGLILFFSLFVTASLYLSYPRHDYYEIGHGYNVSASDLKTVNYIEKDAGGVDYVVLANQTVAAAAVKELGFKKYYNNNFFYPIPTGGPLYQIFLKMVYEEPYRETALAAKKLTGVNTVYFVLNDYWQSAPDIAELARETADKWAVIDGGKTYVFRYEFR